MVAVTLSNPRLFTLDQLAAKNYPHTMSGPDKAYWVSVAKKDFATIRDKQCFINITDQPPPGPPPPPVEQRFRIKYKGEAPIALTDIKEEDWKVRTIIRGDRFKQGVHFDRTAAPVIHTAALKMLVAWAVALGLLLFAWDQTSAFYGNTMDRPGIIVRLPAGYDPYSTELRPLDLPALYAELAGALPGIPQGSLLHYIELKPDLQRLGFQPLPADNCLFLHDSLPMATTLYVDDGVLACPSIAHAERTLGPMGLGRTRQLTWGPLTHQLGIDFTVSYSATKRVVFMCQSAYTATILERAGMTNCNTVRTPATAGRRYTKDDCPSTDEERAKLSTRGLTKERYHSVQASLNFLVGTTRDDMHFINGKQAKFCADPGDEHFKSQNHQLRFLQGTRHYGIEFVWRAADHAPLDGPLNIEAWSDSSFADDMDSQRTTLGFLVKANGATVTSSSKLSACVDSCVNHSELNAFASAAAPPSPHAPGPLTDGASVAWFRTARTVAWIRGVKAGLERRDVDSMPPTKVTSTTPASSPCSATSP